VPTDLPFPEERVIGADTLHVALRDILRHLGHRRGITEPDAPPGDASTDAAPVVTESREQLVPDE
jgi:hypothetical protein